MPADRQSQTSPLPAGNQSGQAKGKGKKRQAKAPSPPTQSVSQPQSTQAQQPPRGAAPQQTPHLLMPGQSSGPSRPSQPGMQQHPIAEEDDLLLLDESSLAASSQSLSQASPQGHLNSIELLLLDELDPETPQVASIPVLVPSSAGGGGSAGAPQLDASGTGQDQQGGRDEGEWLIQL
ncbi:hypothetical protein VTJ49DRAFT_782 [Mycothermus thermophilus]|uniref:Uncharacterized protein n=1 Tax=Humicola insolens TaxID=85995 RepID=A0ABR3VEE0_HUMIN